MLRLLVLLALSAGLSSCSLFGLGCPPTAFGEECDVLGEWRLQTLGGEAATGRLELEDLGDAYVVLPSGIEGCESLRGAARWSLSDTEGTFEVRLWNARAECDDGGGLAYTVDFGGRYELDGDRLSVTWYPDARLASNGSTSDTTIPALGDLASLVFVR